MQLSQLDAWIKVGISLIPAVLVFIAAFTVFRRHRQWFTIALVVAAAINIPLPIGIAMTQGGINQMKIEIQSQKTQAEAQQLLAKYSGSLQNNTTLLNWLIQGTYFSNLAFAIGLIMTIRYLISMSAPGAADKSASAATPPADGTPETNS